MNKKRILHIMLILSIFFTLVSCGNEKTDKISNEPLIKEQPIVLSETGEWLGKGGCYKLEILNEGDYYRMRGNTDHLIFMNMNQIYNQAGNILLNNYANAYTVVEDGIWCACEKGFIDGEYSQDCYVMKLDFTGNQIAFFDIPIRADSFSVVSEHICIYDTINQILGVFDTNGNEQGNVDLSSAELEEFSGHLFTGGDGSVWLLSDVESSKMLYPVDLTTLKLGTPCELPTEMVDLTTGTSEHIFMLSTTTALSYFDPVSNAATNILYWDECGISNGELNNFIPDDDGFLCLSVIGLCRLQPADSDEIKPKTRLTVGTTVPYDVSNELATRFNTVNSNYYVDVIDYSNNGELSPEEAQVKLNADVISGKGPDMVMLYDMEALQNASNFADLYPFIDEDSELSRDDFYGLKAIETNGTLLVAPSSLSISTFYTMSDFAKNRTGWTWDDYFEVENNLPAGGVMAPYLSAEFFLQSSLDLYAPKALDWKKGTCNFDTPEFVRILEAAKKGYDPNCPIENPYFMDEVNSMMADGQMILESAYFFDVGSFAQSEGYCGREISYIGWPTTDGTCGSVFQVSGVSICATTNYMDGCWEFTKYILKSTYAYKPTFENAINAALTQVPTDAGEQKALLTENQANRYRTLMENITVAVTNNSKISSIVQEEAAAMFAGDKDPSETAKLIQNRISVYVAEHK